MTRLFDRPVESARVAQPMLSLELASGPMPCVDPNVVPPWRFPTSGIANGGGADDGGVPVHPRRDEIVPLNANLRRVHFNVDRQVVRKLKDAREGPREPIPAAVRRAVWERDQGRCTWPLDGGGCCGSTHRLELDHLIPWAEWGPSTVENLRVVCNRHNALAARQIFGARCVERYARKRGPRRDSA